jgi:hypothetical protein
VFRDIHACSMWVSFLSAKICVGLTNLLTFGHSKKAAEHVCVMYVRRPCIGEWANLADRMQRLPIYCT